MRLKHEIRRLEAPHSLILSNHSTRDVIEPVLKKSDIVSPETLSHRLQKGWQHLQESPETFLNNNNTLPSDFNDNQEDLDDVSDVTSSEDINNPYFDGDYQAMSSDESGSSSEDESSASYSDTSPLLDVSSLGGNSSDVSFDSDMSEDSSSTTSGDSSSSSEDLDECNNLNDDNNNNESENQSMQSSWMSFSSAASSSPSLAGPSRGDVILPDVLPVGKVARDNEDAVVESSPRNVEITFEKRKSNVVTGSSRVGGDCCLVEITAQPDVQVDIRVNPMPARTYRESTTAVKHGNTYPREAKKYLKNRDANMWIVNDSFEEHSDDAPPKYWGLGEGIRLNNFTIVNGYKTLSLTELVKPEPEPITEPKIEDSIPTDNSRFQKPNNSPPLNTYQNFERNYSKLPASVHMCCKDNWRFQKESNSVYKQKAIVETNQCNSFPLKKDVYDSVTTSPKQNITHNNSFLDKPKPPIPPRVTNKEHNNSFLDKPKPTIPPRVSNIDDNSNKYVAAKQIPQKPKDLIRKEISNYTPKTKSNESKKSPELYDVYSMESALRHINWAAISKSSRESEWIRKRRNDREEIRRKLAMDSDTEDYISEKLSQHRDSGGSFDRLKGSGNLQICFMNEAAKDQDLPNAESSTNIPVEKPTPPVPQAPKPSVQLPSSNSPKCDKGAPKTLNNNISKPSVTKRQRPKFFFNRPRSWHAAKPEQEPHAEEDLLTRHVRLQAEAREALAQAKDMARMQMEIERQKKKKSPIAEMVGLPFPDGKNFLTHNALAAMNVAQLQVIVNDLHSQIETLNEDLVKLLLERDDLHMEQDSMLVDIEDLTKYLGLKGNNSAASKSTSQIPAGSATTKKNPKRETVRRSQSVHLKPKNLMWPLHQLALFSNGCSRR